MDSASQLQHWLEHRDLNHRLNPIPLIQTKVSKGECVVRAVLFLHKEESGEQHYVQILVASERFIQPALLNQYFGGSFEALTGSQVPKAFTHLPALPRWQGLNCYVDAALFEFDRLYLDCLHKQASVKLQQNDFQQIIKQSRSAPFSHCAEKQKESLASSTDFALQRLKQRLSKPIELEIFPPSVEALKQLEFSYQQRAHIEHIFQADASLAAQLLRHCNAVEYRHDRCLRSALEMFDTQELCEFGLSLKASALPTKHDRIVGRRYQKQSLVVSQAITTLACLSEKDEGISLGLAKLTGLLHNFGQLLIYQLCPNYQEHIHSLLKANPHQSYLAIQSELMGVSHSNITAYLLEQWGLADAVVTAVREQNNSNYQGPYRDYVLLLRCAVHLLSKSGSIHGSLNCNYKEDLAELKIKEFDAEAIQIGRAHV